MSWWVWFPASLLSAFPYNASTCARNQILIRISPACVSHTNCCHVFRIWNSFGLRPGRYPEFCRTGFLCNRFSHVCLGRVLASKRRCSAWDKQQEHFVLVRTTSVHIQLVSNEAAKQNEETQETFIGVLVPVNIFTQHLGLTG